MTKVISLHIAGNASIVDWTELFVNPTKFPFVKV